jgi:hypothetical protein
MVAVPAAIPVTSPPGVTDTLVLLLLQVPPVMASVSVVVEPTQTPGAPAIVPASGVALMVIFFVAITDPQALATV